MTQFASISWIPRGVSGPDTLDLVQLHCVPTEVLRDGGLSSTS